MYLFVANQSNYFIELSIKIGKADTPFAEVIIEGNSYLLEFDTGSKSALMLRKPLLEKIRNKKLYGSGEWKNVKGDSYQAPKYLVPKVKIGGLSFKEIVI